MGIWAGIKHALNSTLGTADFKPLDKLIIEQTRIIASDDVYCSLGEASVKSSNIAEEIKTLVYPDKIKMIRSGTIRMGGTLTRSNYLRAKGWLIIYKNGEQIYEWYIAAGGDSAQSFTKDISVKLNDILSFELRTAVNTDNYTNTLTLSGFSINGKIEHNIFEIV